MLINQLRLEGAKQDYMIQRSFHQFQKDRDALAIHDQKRDLEVELLKVEDLKAAVKDVSSLDFSVEEAIADHYFLVKEREKKQEDLRKIVTQPEHIVPYLNPGRLLHVKDGSVDWGWGILVAASSRRVEAVEEDDADRKWVLEVFLPCDPSADPPVPAPMPKAQGKVLPLSLDAVQRISTIRSNMPEGDAKTEDNCRVLLKTLGTIKRHKKFKAGIPELNPVTEMKIESEELTAIQTSLSGFQQKLDQSPLASHPKLTAYLSAFERRVKLQTQVQDLDTQIGQSRFMVMNDELRAMRRVLRRLEFIDKDGVVQLKGRMACELTSADEILLTEIVFQNVFADMEANHIIALCSCLVFDEQSDDVGSGNVELMKAYDVVRGIARNVGEIMAECKITLDVEEYVKKVKPQLMDTILAWLDGKRFYEIMNGCSLYEGSVVRVIRRLEELIRELATAAKGIGNQELANKLMEGRAKLKRGIIFTASLYL